MNLLRGIKNKLSNGITNVLSGPDFNRNAFDEAHRRPLKLRETEGNDTPEPDEEEWSNLTKVSGGMRAHDQVNLEDEFRVKEKTSTSVLRQLKARIPEKAVENLCEVAGVSKEYAVFALGFISKKMGCDIGWLSNEATVLNVVMKIKNECPYVEDVKEASRKSVSVPPDEEDEYLADREAEEEQKKNMMEH